MLQKHAALRPALRARDCGSAHSSPQLCMPCGRVQQSSSVQGFSLPAMPCLLPGQANQRILDNAALRLGVPPARVISNLAEYGNTSAASIPLALDEAVRANTISQGHVVRALCRSQGAVLPTRAHPPRALTRPYTPHCRPGATWCAAHSISNQG